MLGVPNCMLNRLTRLRALHRHAVHPKQRSGVGADRSPTGSPTTRDDAESAEEVRCR